MHWGDCYHTGEDGEAGGAVAHSMAAASLMAFETPGPRTLMMMLMTRQRRRAKRAEID
jgi:hypothetical protein